MKRNGRFSFGYYDQDVPTVVTVFGPGALREALAPSSDPKIRELEEELVALQIRFYGRIFTSSPPQHDPLPAHYRDIKVRT